jgi:hypothetical protein
MKRKLIDFNTFRAIQTESLSNTQQELEESAELLARALELEGLRLDSFGQDNVLFETLDGNHVHANYQIQKGFVQFDNVEQLVINEESEVKESKEIISKMIDSLVESDDAKAENFLNEWLGLPRTKRIFNEEMAWRATPVRKTVNGETEIVGYKRKRWHTGTPKYRRNRSDVVRSSKSRKKKNKVTPIGVKNLRKSQRERVKPKNMKEWHVIAENVLSFVDLNQNGPLVGQTQILRKDGEVVSVRVPTIKLKNEAKLLSFNWKTMNTDVVVKRNSSKKLHENNEFVKEVSELKRANALSDNKALEESLESTSVKFPEIIYLTEAELAGQVKRCLESVNASNYDDETCRFIAEGLLRTVHDTFVDRVAKILKLAGAKLNEEAQDKYAEFKNVVEQFYKTLDESSMLEMQAFVDVYEALRQVHEVAVEEKNTEVAEETAYHLDSLLQILEQKEELNFETLGEAAEWLYDIVEVSSEEWKTEEPVVVVDGEHPDLAKKGKTSQSPAQMQGETPSAQYTSDGKDYKGSAAQELENDGWSNVGGEGVYPSLENPYVPKAEIPKIKGEKDVDSDSDQLAHWGNNETWPNLQNPYVKQSVTPESAE